MCVFLMPVWGITALLRLDYHLRTPKLRRLFRCPEGKKGVVSDTTIARTLRPGRTSSRTKTPEQ